MMPRTCYNVRTKANTKSVFCAVNLYKKSFLVLPKIIQTGERKLIEKSLLKLPKV